MYKAVIIDDRGIAQIMSLKRAGNFCNADITVVRKRGHMEVKFVPRGCGPFTKIHTRNLSEVTIPHKGGVLAVFNPKSATQLQSIITNLCREIKGTN